MKKEVNSPSESVSGAALPSEACVKIKWGDFDEGELELAQSTGERSSIELTGIVCDNQDGPYSTPQRGANSGAQSSKEGRSSPLHKRSLTSTSSRSYRHKKEGADAAEGVQGATVRCLSAGGFPTDG